MKKRNVCFMMGAAALLSTVNQNNLLVQAEESVERKATGLVQLWQTVPDGQTSEGASTSRILSQLQCRPNHDLYPTGGNSQHSTYVNSCYVDDALYLGEDSNYYYIYLAGYEGKVAKTKSHYFNLDLNGDGKTVKYEIQTVAYFIPDGGKSAEMRSISDDSTTATVLEYSTDTLAKDFSESLNVDARGVTGTVQSPSYYANENGTLAHYLTNNVRSTGYSKTIVGKAPSWMRASTKYYSYDGIYFYADWRNIQVNGSGAVNESNPFYNYYQYLPFRSTTNYTASQIDSYTKYYGYTSVPSSYPAASNQSELVGAGKYFSAVQTDYGINGLLQYAMGIHESGWGRSSLSINKNNLFGMNATDNNPYGNGTSFPTIEDGINYHADRYLSWGYTDPVSDARYFGSHVGNKGSGMNVKYASDPFWGEKIAGWYHRIDSYLGSKDYNYYSIGIKQSTDKYNVRSGANTSSSVYYQTRNGKSNYTISNYPVLITGASGDFYKIKTDTPIVNGSPKYSGTYDWNTTSGYLSKGAIDVVNHTNYKTPGTVTVTKSNNANLKALTSNIGSWNPNFNKNTTDYTVNLSEYASQITLSGSVEDSKASITSGLGTHNLVVGNNVIEVKTKAEDGTTKTYKVTVVVPKKKSSNANLRALVPNVGTLSPAFSQNKTSYTLTVPAGVKYVLLKGALADETATVVSGLVQHQIDPDVLEGQKLTVKTKAEDGTTKTYTLNVKMSSPYYAVSKINSLSFSNKKLYLDGYSYVRTVDIPNSSDTIKKLKFTDVKTNKQVKTYVLPNLKNSALSTSSNHGAGKYNYQWGKFDTGLNISDLPVGEYVLKVYTKAKDKQFDVVIPYHTSFKDFSFELNGKSYLFTTSRTDNTPSIRIVVTKK